MFANEVKTSDFATDLACIRRKDVQDLVTCICENKHGHQDIQR